MKRHATLLLVAISYLSVCAATHDDIIMNYTIGIDTVGKYLNVELECECQGHPDGLLLKMPVWAPGDYQIHDYPKHLCDFRAADAHGNEVKWYKEGKNGWRVMMPADGAVKVSYRVFANERDVAKSRIDSRSAFIAPNGVFMYVDGFKESPVTVTYDVPVNWASISTGLVANKDAVHTYTAANIDELYDSPFLLGNHLVRHFMHEGRNYEFALDTPQGLDEPLFEDCFRKIVSASTRIMGDVPYDNYTLIHMDKELMGLEHSNSQACYVDYPFSTIDRKQWLNYLALTVHEYFHVYNVKTIRPIELGPFDYDREVLTPLLWFCEGITCYYEARILYLAGLVTQEEMFELISKYMRQDEAYQAHHHQSLRQASYDAWLYHLSEDANTNDVNVNFYFRGSVVGLIMDIEIRRISDGRRTLDDLMRLLYNRYYRQQGRGFTEKEFWTSVDEIAGGSMSHIRDMVDNTGDIDYEKYFSAAGLSLDRATWTISSVKHVNIMFE